jgi:prolyl oligopeptidase
MRRFALLLVLTLCVSVLAQQPQLPPPPPTPKKPVTDVYNSVKVVDNYQWLEQSNNPQVKQWVTAQSERSRNYLDSLPVHRELVDWLDQLMKSFSVSYGGIEPAGGLLFAMKSQPGKQQDLVVTLRSADDPSSEHVVVDPNVLDPKGNTSVQFFAPSLDGHLVAVCLAEGGSESGTIHVYETASGKALPDVVPRVNFPTAGGSVAWNSDGTGFWYTRYPHKGERPPQDENFYQEVYFHKLGTPDTQDAYAIGKDFPRIAEISLESGAGGRYLLAIVENGDGGQYEHFLRDPQGKWTQITHFEDNISAATFGADNALYMVSRKNAPRGKMLRLPVATPELSKATVVVPESNYVIQGFGFALSGFPANYAATKDRLYVVDEIGGPNQVRIFDHSGKQLGTVPIEPVSAVSQVVKLDNGDLLFQNENYTRPGAWFRYDPQQNKTVETALHTTSPVNFDEIEVSRETATSKDGTKVPLTVLYKKGLKKDGNHPTILTGYGGFGLSITPGFNPTLAPWLDSGGVYAIANLRGGGEFGEEWHKAGVLTNKQHVFDDFIACSEHLIKSGYTNSKKFGIEGGSNGGLLMGAVLTQRPDLFRAVVSVAGLYDMLRFETTQNGQFNATEYGSVKNPEQFKALYAYSPYHYVKPGAKYPAILLTVGENDLRVDPWHSSKYAAALQAASTSGLPILLLSYANAGHGGIGSSENQEVVMLADGMSFMFDQLGMPFTAPKLEKPAGQ